MTSDKVLARVVNALRAFKRGIKGTIRRPSVAQSVPVLGPVNLFQIIDLENINFLLFIN